MTVSGGCNDKKDILEEDDRKENLPTKRKHKKRDIGPTMKSRRSTGRKLRLMSEIKSLLEGI